MAVLCVCVCAFSVGFAPSFGSISTIIFCQLFDSFVLISLQANKLRRYSLIGPFHHHHHHRQQWHNARYDSNPNLL